MPSTAASSPLRFDYVGARRAGFTDQQIAQSLGRKRAQGLDVYVDRTEVQTYRRTAGTTPPTALPQDARTAAATVRAGLTPPKAPSTQPVGPEAIHGALPGFGGISSPGVSRTEGIPEVIGGIARGAGQTAIDFVRSIPEQLRQFYEQGGQPPALPGEPPEATAARGAAYQEAARTIAGYTPLKTPIGAVLPLMAAQGATQVIQAGAPVETAAGPAPPTAGEVGERLGAGAAGLAMGVPGLLHGVVGRVVQKAKPPTAAETAAVRRNIVPPPTLKPQLRSVSETASLELGHSIDQMQKRATVPIRFDAPGILTVEDAHIVPNLVRVFPGDVNPVRVTVVDNATGEIHSIALPSIGSLREALKAGRPRPAPKPEAAAPQVAVEEVPAAPEKPGPPRKRTREEYAAQQATIRQAVAQVPESIARVKERTAEAPRAIAALERQIAENPGDKRVGRWKRRVEKLKSIAPEPERAAVPPPSARATIPAAVSTAPPVEPTTAKSPEPAAAPARPARARPTAAPIPREKAAAPARMLVPNMQFRDERSASSFAVHVARGEPGSEPKVVKTRKGYEIEINETPGPAEQLAGGREKLGVSTREAAAPAEEIVAGRSKVAREPTAEEAATMKPGETKVIKGHVVHRTTPEFEQRIARTERRTAGATSLEGGVAIAERRVPEAPGRRAEDAKRFREIQSEAEKTIRRIRAAKTHTDLVALHEELHPGVSTKYLSSRELHEILLREAQAAVRGAKEAGTAEPVSATGKAERAKPGEPTAPAAPPKVPSRSFTEVFEDLARQGRTLQEATEQARAASGSEPPAGLDLESRWSRVQREAREGAGQTDIFGGAAMLGRPAGERTEADIDMPERAAPPSVSEVATRAAKPSEAKDVPLEGLWYWRGFQNRDVARGTEPTQEARELVNAAHVKMLSETRGGFDLDEVVRRPILVWRDAAGELGPAGRRYVIDGHHRAYMAKEAGAKMLPAVEVFGDLAYAKDQARLSNLASVPNTFYEQARIARELSERGDSWEKVAAQLRVRISRAKAMVDFAHLDPEIRGTFFPPGNETLIFNGTAHGEAVGRYARESPELMTSNMQRQWLTHAIDDDVSATAFTEEVRRWHTLLKAARQEIINLGAELRGTSLSMTPKQFADTSGRLTAAVDSRRRQAEAAVRALETVSEMARGEGHNEAKAFVDRKAIEAAEEGARLSRARREIDTAILEALSAAAKGERDLPTSFDAIQKRVDDIVGPSPPRRALAGESGIVRARQGDLIQAILNARRRLTGIARRDRIVRQLAKGPPPPTGAAARILEALKKAAPTRERQEASYTAERIRRIKLAREAERGKTGMARHIARLQSLKGPYQKIDFESIAKALSQADINELVNAIYDHPALQFFEKANAGRALRKLIGEEGVEVPQANELALLEVVFGSDFVDTIAGLRPQLLKLKDLPYAIGSVSRALRTSFDLSAALRQGLYLGASFPKEWGRAWLDQHRYWWTEENFKEGMQEIYNDPAYGLARKARLSITRSASALLQAQEEAFFGANLAENLHGPVEKLIPGKVGKIVASPLRVVSSGVRRSDRSYTGFLNKLRFDVFKALVGMAKKSSRAKYLKALKRGRGIADARRTADRWDPEKNLDLARGIAKFVNSATGRGDSKFIGKYAPLLNFIFFAPRLIKSRLDLLNPRNYVAGHPFVRQQYIRSSAVFAGEAALVLTLASWAGARVEHERRNGDWGKIRVGKNVYDILGGLVQYLRFFPTVAEALYEQARGKKLRYGNAAEITSRFIEHKLAPVPEFLLGWYRGLATERDIRKRGKRGKFQIGPELMKLFTPMVGEDFFEVMKSDPRQAPVALPAAVYGVSVGTYLRPRR